MAKDWAKSFYKSVQWQECRLAYIASVKGMCERCGKVGYIVHHKTYLTPENINNPDISLNFDNLEYLCLDCHNAEHFGEAEVCGSDLCFNEKGELCRRKTVPPG